MHIPDNMCTTQYFSVVLDLVSKLVPPALPRLLVRQGGLELAYTYMQRIRIIRIKRSLHPVLSCIRLQRHTYKQINTYLDI